MAVREGWNFHNDIGMKIEMIARARLHHIGNHSGEFTNADNIESGSFVEAMLYILRQILGLQEDLDEFARKCSPYLGMQGHKIPPEEAEALIKEFAGMIDE